MTLTPAYGRDYKTATAARADFEAGKDFIIQDISSPWDGKPVNNAQLSPEDLQTVVLRFDRLTKTAHAIK